MLNHKYSLLLFSTLSFMFISICSSLYIEKHPAKVLISEDRSVDDGYMVEIEANGETRLLRLTPMESIWSDDAQSLTITTNEEGEEIYVRKAIPKDIKVYHDSEVGSFLSLNDGKVNGILDSEYLIKSEEENHFVVKTNKNEYSKNDYKILPKDIPKRNRRRLFRGERNNTQKVPIPVMAEEYFRAVTTHTPEVAVISDSKLSNLLGTDSNNILYFTIFWNAVDRRFKTITEYTIKLKLVGLIIIRNSSAEPFISNNLNGQKAYGDKVLNDESYWVFKKMSTLAAHDLIYLQTGRDLIEKNNDTGLGGIAYMGAACVKNDGGGRSYAVGLGEDMGAFYDGVHIATHEVAHILGAPHDGDKEDGTEDCLWEKGNIMSYEAGTIYHLFFSPCSIRKMSSYLSSTEAACVHTNLGQTNPPGVFTSTNLPGDKISMDQFCKKITGISNAVVSTEVDDEDSLCYNMQCEYSDWEGDFIEETLESAPEGALCPSGGRCKDGACI